MSVNANFMASLMKIPYFAQLADSNGEQWLTDIFNTLETSNFDFSKFEYADSSDGGDNATSTGGDFTYAPVDLGSSDAVPTVDVTAAVAAASDDTVPGQASETPTDITPKLD